MTAKGSREPAALLPTADCWKGQLLVSVAGEELGMLEWHPRMVPTVDGSAPPIPGSGTWLLTGTASALLFIALPLQEKSGFALYRPCFHCWYALSQIQLIQLPHFMLKGPNSSQIKPWPHYCPGLLPYLNLGSRYTARQNYIYIVNEFLNLKAYRAAITYSIDYGPRTTTKT